MSEKKRAIAMEQSQSERYAVVKLRWDEAFPELVIEYCDEESLRKAIDARNIIAIALSSREAATGVSQIARRVMSILRHFWKSLLPWMETTTAKFNRRGQFFDTNPGLLNFGVSLVQRYIEVSPLAF